MEHKIFIEKVYWGILSLCYTYINLSTEVCPFYLINHETTLQRRMTACNLIRSKMIRRPVELQILQSAFLPIQQQS